MEDSLPAKAMVFQLPAVEFPEAPPAGDLAPYSHFRPYLYSHRLQFSYGDGKGRTRPTWQQDVQQLRPADMIHTLEQYGFAAILIHRLGYADRGAALREAIGAEGGRELLNESDDYFAIRLQPSRVPLSPPDFAQNWDALEITPNGNHRWAFGEAVIILQNQHPESQTVRLRFGIGTVQPRRIVIKLDDQTLLDRNLSAGEQLPEVELRAELSPGSNSLHFWSDRPGEPPGNGDPRKLAFMLKNFSVAN
jgi:hypothetical protein